MILIIANARIKGGLSGGDNIYIHLAEASGEHVIWEMMDTDFKPFVLCYIWKVIKACFKALWWAESYEFVYSASDFWMDSLPAFILKLKGNRWVAGFYMFAPKKNLIYYYSQKPIKWLIDRYADVVCVTHESLVRFKKPCVIVRGGVDLKLAFQGKKKKDFDAVFVGRFHHTKGIMNLMKIWEMVVKKIPSAKLAIIGDGDDESFKIKGWAKARPSVTLFGFMGDERFDVYSKSKMVLYPTPLEYSHFSMAPIEAMACGCPMVCYDLPEMESLKLESSIFRASDTIQFVEMIVALIKNYDSISSIKESAINYADTWDWDVRSKSIIKKIREVLCIA